jgi:hypothetical protein
MSIEVLVIIALRQSAPRVTVFSRNIIACCRSQYSAANTHTASK